MLRKKYCGNFDIIYNKDKKCLDKIKKINRQCALYRRRKNGDTTK